MIPPNFSPAPGFPETRKTLASFHAALAKALPKKAVYLSSIGAEQTSGLGLITSLHLLERTLAFLRAGWFMENHAWDITTAQSEGRIFSNLFPLDRKFSLVLRLTSARPGRMSCGRNGQEPDILRLPVPSSIPPTILREH
jgi:NAD(P)H dehydrogenase (quinone)